MSPRRASWSCGSIAFAVRPAPHSGSRRRWQFAGEGLRHHAGNGVAVDRQPDQRSPHRQAGDEGTRAVDRIDHPDMPAVDVLAAMFLAENAMVGILSRYQRADDPLGLAIGFGHRVETALFLVGHRALAAEARQGLGRRCLRDAPHEIDADIQLILPRCGMPEPSFAASFQPRQGDAETFMGLQALHKCHASVINAQFPHKSELNKPRVD